jgi:conjugative coupling factor TraD (TOL family)
VLAPWALMMPARLGRVCAVLALAFALRRARQGTEVLRYQHGLKFYRVTRVAPHRIPVQPGLLYLGEGFAWTQLHTQRKMDASRPDARPFVTPSPIELGLRQFGARLEAWSTEHLAHPSPLRPVAQAARALVSMPVWWNPLLPFVDLGGTPVLHGVGLDEAPVTLRQSARNGHMVVMGTTRVGKSRLLELLATQDIHAGHVVIVIDPKGDADLMLRMYAEAARAGRLDQFYMFHLGYPDISARYNGIGNFARITEVATRATNALPSSGNSAAFKEFSWRFTNLVAQAQVALGRVPTYETILRDFSGIDLLFLDYAQLVLAREEAAGTVRNWRDRWEDIQESIAARKTPVPRALADRGPPLVAMVLLVKELRLADPVLGGLSTAVSYEKTFFEKITASLGPFLEKLITGAVGKLISPDYFDPADKRPVFDWMQIIRQGGIVYVGLDALSDSVVSSAVGNSMLSDLVSVGGKLYKTSLDPHHPQGKIVLPTVCCHFDEVNEICGPEFVPMVNKLGGSGFRITAYTQSLYDFEARVGDKAKAGQILDNFNHQVMLRVRSTATANLLAEQVPEVDVTTLMVVSGVTDSTADGSGVDFVSRNEDRVTTTRAPMITASDLLSLPQGQAFALLEGNGVWGSVEQKVHLSQKRMKFAQYMRLPHMRRGAPGNVTPRASFAATTTGGFHAQTAGNSGGLAGREHERAVPAQGRSGRPAPRYETSRQLAHQWATQVYEVFRPAGWVTETVTLPPDLMEQVQAMEKEARKAWADALPPPRVTRR